MRAIAVLESFSHPREKLVAVPGLLASEWLSMRDSLARLYRDIGRHEEADAVESELRALLAVADDESRIRARRAEGRLCRSRGGVDSDI